MISYVLACLSTPCWWMPDSCANAFLPTIALLACTSIPVYLATILLVLMICWVLMVQCTGKCCGRVRNAITTSSSDVFPARSPRELSVTSTCLAPACTAASELAVARPKSLWQWVDHTALCESLVFAMQYAKMLAYSSGRVYPTVSGKLIVVAPASMTAAHNSTRNSGSERPASSGENSMLSHRLRAKPTISDEMARHSARVIPSLCSRWMSDDARNVWMRHSSAWRTAS
mmetsp:Transcript_22698/g.46250  ORF Transcript_22698/g.46250 Transcript_22698/m.46250 type:complete len:230 (+) Transcript_22698:996-1685(+)